jgi:hypothetical protein
MLIFRTPARMSVMCVLEHASLTGELIPSFDLTAKLISQLDLAEKLIYQSGRHEIDKNCIYEDIEL